MEKKKKLPQTVWDSMKNEYLTGSISLRALARKYELTYSTVISRAKVEEWEDERNKLNAEVAEAVAKTQTAKAQSNTEKAELAIGTVLDKVIIASAMVSPADTKSLKDITAMMKDLKELQVFTVKNADEDTVSVSLLPEVDDYAD